MAYKALATIQGGGRFVAARPFAFRGVQLAKGDTFPSDVPPVRLNQLFKHRKITWINAEPETPAPAGKKEK